MCGDYAELGIKNIMPSSGLCRVAYQSQIEIPTFLGSHHKSMLDYSA